MPFSRPDLARWFALRVALPVPATPALAVAYADRPTHRTPARPAAPTRRAPPPTLVEDMLHNLPQGTTLAIDDPLGQEVWCLSGALWITHDEDGKDVVLPAGKGYVADRRERLLVHALDDARFIVQTFDR